MLAPLAAANENWALERVRPFPALPASGATEVPSSWLPRAVASEAVTELVTAMSPATAPLEASRWASRPTVVVLTVALAVKSPETAPDS